MFALPRVSGGSRCQPVCGAEGKGWPALKSCVLFILEIFPVL